MRVLVLCFCLFKLATDNSYLSKNATPVRLFFFSLPPQNKPPSDRFMEDRDAPSRAFKKKQKKKKTTWNLFYVVNKTGTADSNAHPVMHQIFRTKEFVSLNAPLSEFRVRAWWVCVCVCVLFLRDARHGTVGVGLSTETRRANWQGIGWH